MGPVVDPTIKDPIELAYMRQSGKRLAEVAALLRESIKPGVTTLELDEIAERAILDRKSVPAFKGYRVGPNVFPNTICASPNEVIVHGIPNDKALVDGDVISIDVGLVHMGYYSDCAFTVAIGDVPPRVRELLDVTEKSLYEGIALAMPDNTVGDIGHAIQSFVQPHGFGIVREFVGHGVGRRLHEPPSVPNYGKPRKGQLINVGNCLAIEPMITMGNPKTKILKDGWTVITDDRKLAAHFEHTIAVTPRGPEILTTLG